VFLNNDALKELLSKSSETKAVSDWVAAGSPHPSPSVGGLLLHPAEVRPADLPDWSPWMPGAHSLVTQGRLQWVTQWLHPTAPIAFQEAITAAMRAVGLAASKPPLPAGLLPIEFTAGAPEGAQHKEGRLVFAVHGVDRNAVGYVSFVLVRP
jgi:hypothetical protein